MPDFQYRKSSHSNPERECVEVATNVPTVVAVRDSKRPASPSLRFAPSAWRAFHASLLKGDTPTV
ncbi:DUF397 domain-containing protein [Streptomyces thermoalcalitolerans]|uniref:DUF397 domain-containing protein n=1 Tax=Streptomyces thermoalcalitolerans TaxID=65605 RepID=A0ABP3ZK35_9ACTN